jgi:hypothetical protein
MYHKDHLLITVEDWEGCVFRLEREPASHINQELLQERDRILVDIFYDMLERARYEELYQHIAVPKAYALMPEKDGYPAHHWMIALEADGRMTFDDWRIHYRDSGYSPFELIMMEQFGPRPEPSLQKYTREQAEQVYSFKAQLKYNARIWRRIEIQGGQTLGDLDVSLRHAFDYDTFDHLSGFWKLVARHGGQRTRYREVGLGNINPFEGGEASDIQIAALGLQVGDRLKYVYDFGDWVEHTLTLESIDAPQKTVKYPRQTGQNKPKYVYCVSCQRRGKQVVATWICLTCSNRKSEEIVLCEKCIDQHEDHYVEEILY